MAAGFITTQHQLIVVKGFGSERFGYLIQSKFGVDCGGRSTRSEVEGGGGRVFLYTGSPCLQGITHPPPGWLLAGPSTSMYRYLWHHINFRHTGM